MKAFSTALPLLVATSMVFISGCASSGPTLVLAPVGPEQPVASPLSDKGTLLVYSAFNTGLPSPSLPDDIQQHSNYQLFSNDGKLLQVVPNRAGFQGEDPLPLHLAPGSYRVTARSNGHGLVTVPVVIAENKVTIVHLEGGASWSEGDMTAENSVCLPNGEIIGWKAADKK
jgi:hypothetical protein